MMYTIYCEWKYRNVLLQKSSFLKYIGILFLITFISLVLGLINYPFYDVILNGPVDQVEKIPKVLNLLQANGIKIEYKQLLSLWMLARPIKGLVMDLFYSFGGAYMIFCWYYKEWKKGFNIAIASMIPALLLMLAVSFVEVFYLSGHKWANSFLVNVNPFFHAIKVDGAWYPPLLWQKQVRSVFPEPSHMCMYLAFALPFLWYKVIRSKNMIWPVIVTLTASLIFLAKARTGFMLFVGETALLFLATGWFMRQKQYLFKVGVILLCSTIAFIGSNYFIASYIDKKPAITVNEANKIDRKNVAVHVNKDKPKAPKQSAVNLKNSMTAYVDSNAGSLLNPDRRSNRARYSVMEADFKIGLDHPLLGVGKGLRNAYIPQYLSQKAMENGEVKMWLSFRKKLGIMRFSFPALGEYTVKFAETGIIGLIAFMAPVLLLIIKMMKKLRNSTTYCKLEYIVYLISLAGIIASGIGDNLHITYCYWVLLGLGYAMCFGSSDENKEINERA